MKTDHGEVAIVRGQTQAQFGLHLWEHALQHAVENVVVSLIWCLQTPSGKKR